MKIPAPLVIVAGLALAGFYLYSQRGGSSAAPLPKNDTPPPPPARAPVRRIF